MSASPPPAGRPGPRLAALFIYAAAMGWLEAVVVVYIRALLGLAHGGAAPGPDEMTRRLQGVPWLSGTEQGRELATIVMLAAVAFLAARRARARLGAFLIAFGTWDIVYYLALYLLLGWPPSLGTRDLLFLIPPGPWWYQPVAAPVAISAVMIAAGAWLFLREPAPRPS
jgi:hypothetical protein